MQTTPKSCHGMGSGDSTVVNICEALPKKAERKARTNNNNAFTQFEIAKNLYTSGLLQKYKLSASAKLVLIALVNHYNPKKKDMFPSQKFMSNQLGISEKSAERAIKDLKASGLIIYATKKVNHYKFTQKFFDEIKMSDSFRQNVGNDTRQNVGQTNKHEQKNNMKNNFYKKSWSGNQQAGIEYPQFKPENRELDEKTPFNDLKTAKTYVEELSEMMHIAVIRKKVDEVRNCWGEKLN